MAKATGPVIVDAQFIPSLGSKDDDTHVLLVKALTATTYYWNAPTDIHIRSVGLSRCPAAEDIAIVWKGIQSPGFPLPGATYNEAIIWYCPSSIGGAQQTIIYMNYKIKSGETVGLYQQTGATSTFILVFSTDTQ